MTRFSVGVILWLRDTDDAENDTPIEEEISIEFSNEKDAREWYEHVLREFPALFGGAS